MDFYTVYKSVVRFNFGAGTLIHDYEILSVSWLCSNHPMRLIYVLQSTKIIEIMPAFLRADGEESKANELFLNEFGERLQNPQLRPIFIGDSHVEIMSRARYRIGAKRTENAYAIWLGPRTLTGFGGQGLADEVRRLLGSALITHAESTPIIIISLGSIDARASIYEMFLRGTLHDVSDLERLVMRTIQDAHAIVAAAINFNIADETQRSNVLYGVMSVSCSYTVSSAPANAAEVRQARSVEEFPTFGLFEQRAEYCHAVNRTLRRWCIEAGVLFYDAFPDPEPENSHLFLDGIHLSDPSLLRKGTDQFLGGCQGEWK